LKAGFLAGSGADRGGSQLPAMTTSHLCPVDMLGSARWVAFEPSSLGKPMKFKVLAVVKE
jgi:hypothetical protein